MREHRYYVYIMASRSHNLYIGVTNDLGRRVREHKSHELESFTERYNIDRLVWYGEYDDIRRAINREKQLKGWVREKKIKLIEKLNPTWQDLSAEWGKPIQLLRTERRSFDSAPARLVRRGGRVGENRGRSAQDDSVVIRERQPTTAFRHC